MGTIILSALVAHTGWHWMLDRGEQLARYHFTWPELNAAFFAALLRWAMVAVAMAAAIWLVSAIQRGLAARNRTEASKPPQTA